MTERVPVALLAYLWALRSLSGLTGATGLSGDRKWYLGTIGFIQKRDQEELLAFLDEG
jgi:hypothetical protein